MRRSSAKGLGDSRLSPSSVWRGARGAAPTGRLGRTSQWRWVDPPSTAQRFSPITFNMNDSPARTDTVEAAIGGPDTDRAPSGRGLRQPEHPTGLRRRAPSARRLARWPRAPRRDSGRLPRRAARRGSGRLERLDGGRRGLLPREARRSAHSRRRADGPDAGRVPAHCRRSGARTGAAVRALRPSAARAPDLRGWTL